MEEFWDGLEKIYSKNTRTKEAIDIAKKTQGNLFWERGGKQFVQQCKDWTIGLKVSNLIRYVKADIINNEACFDDQPHAQMVFWATNFWDCVACLGEDKVKELIENMKEKN